MDLERERERESMGSRSLKTDRHGGRSRGKNSEGDCYGERESEVKVRRETFRERETDIYLWI